MGIKKDQQQIEAERRREAQRILNRVERESEQVGTSTMARTANKVRDHFLGEEKQTEDPAEIWGKRIGRGLGVAAFIALAISLYIKYVAK
jgi:preprotein translocase subunit SecF